MTYSNDPYENLFRGANRQRIFFNFSDLFEPSGEWFYANGHVNSEPRIGYIDGGIILKETVTITWADFQNMSHEEWRQLENWAESMSNIVCEELIEKKLLYIWDAIPCITSLEA